MMTSYNILEARNNLSRLVALAESGAEVTLMRRGLPVARIVPIRKPTEPWSGRRLVEWLEAHPLPVASQRTSAEVAETIRELREAGE